VRTGEADDRLAAGSALPELVKGPIRRHNLVEWCAAENDYNTLHYDEAVARATGMPAVVVQGSFQLALAGQMLARVMACADRLASLSITYRKAAFEGGTIIAGGAVTCAADGVIDLGLALRNGDGEVTAEGAARILRGTGAYPPAPAAGEEPPPRVDPRVAHLVTDFAATAIVPTVDLIEAGRVRDYLLALDEDAPAGAAVPPLFLITLGRVRRPHEGRKGKGMMAGSDYWFHAPLAVGDTISARSRIVSGEARGKDVLRALIVSETLLTNQRGEVVARRINRVLRWE